VSTNEAESNHTGERQLMAYLVATGIHAEIVRPGVPMPTVPLAAAAIGVRDEQIIKSVLFKDSAALPVLAVACGTARIDRTALARIAGTGKLRLADAERVLSVTGYPAGGVSPIGHASPVTVVIDDAVMNQDFVFGGAGSEETLLRIRPRDIQLSTAAITGSIIERTR
jgi:Cys-tRNA(Pro) deacylase